jgi:hypothetical protein
VARKTTPSFVAELPLVTTPQDERVLGVRFECGRYVYNAVLGESLRRLERLRASAAFAHACSLPRTDAKGEPNKARSRAFGEANAAAGFREYDLHAWVGPIFHSWIGEHLDLMTVQAMATRAFRAVQQYAFGKRGRPRFKGLGQISSVEGKKNDTGLMWKKGEHAVRWTGLVLKARPAHPKDEVLAHGLAARTKYTRLVRRRDGQGKDRYYVQLVCEGTPHRKEKHPLGTGPVGLDLGPSYVAVVAPEASVAYQVKFAAEVDPKWAELRRLKRMLDR